MLAIHDRTTVWMQNLATHVERIVRRNFSHAYKGSAHLLSEWRFRPRSADRIACRFSSVDIALHGLRE